MLVEERSRLRFGSSAAFTIRDADGRLSRLAGGSYPLASGGLFEPGGLKLPLTVEPGSAPLEVEGTRYPGSLTLRGEQTRLQAIVTVPLERYLVGVVSSECFGSWPQQTLRAQAVASRTYALANLNPAAAFDLHDDDRSQNYHGLAREFPSASAAVAATAGETLLYGGRPIQAFFTASNGGLTRTAEEAWGGTSLPYIVSRADPFDARSPASDWGPVSVSIDKLRSAFPDVPARIMGAIVTHERCAPGGGRGHAAGRGRITERDPGFCIPEASWSPLALPDRRHRFVASR